MQAQKALCRLVKMSLQTYAGNCPNHVLLCSVAAFPQPQRRYSLWGLLRKTRRYSQARARQSTAFSLLSPRIQRFSISAFIAFRLPGNCPEKNGQSLVSQPAKAFTNHGCIQTQTQDIWARRLLGKRSPCTLTLAGSPIQKHNWLEVCKLNHCARNFL